MTVFSAATLLFLVMDPFGNIPIFLSILEPYSAARRLRIIAREMLIALAVLMTFLFAGQFILDALSIEESSLTAAGGVILFLIALKMIFPKAGGVMEHTRRRRRTAGGAARHPADRRTLGAGVGDVYYEQRSLEGGRLGRGGVFGLARHRQRADAGGAVFALVGAAGADGDSATDGDDPDGDSHQHDDDGDS